MKKLLIFPAAVAAMAFAAVQANASNPFALTVRANVPQTCDITASGDLDFGTVNPGQQNVLQTTQITPTCNGGAAPINIGFDDGQHPDTGWRNVEHAGATMQYSLYRSGGGPEIGLIASGTSVWTGLTSGVPADLTGLLLNVGANQLAGAYSDVVTISASF